MQQRQSYTFHLLAEMLPFQTISYPQNNCSRPITDESLLSPEVPKRRRRRRRGLTCGVCGHAANYYHFGGASCESCRLFFRRAIQNDTFHLIKCEFGGQCTVTSTTPRKCPACRFAKCLSNGMDPRWVTSADERRTLAENRSYSRQAKHRDTYTRIYRMYDEPDAKEISDLLSEEELITVQSLVDLYKNITRQVRYDDVRMDVVSLVKNGPVDFLFATHVAVQSVRIVDFAKSVLRFSGLKSANIDLLIKKHWYQYSALRNIFECDIQRKCMRKEAAYSDIFTKLTTDYPKSRMSAVLFEKYAEFTGALFKLQLDEPCVLLLLIICLLSTDNIAELTQVGVIEEKQLHFLSILRKYTQWRYGSHSVSVMYPKLLGLLTEAQELEISMNEKHHWMQDAELEYMEKKFGDMNPYKEYSTEKRNRVFMSAATDSDKVLHDSISSSINMLHRGAVSILYEGIRENAILFSGASEYESQASLVDDEALITATTNSFGSDKDINSMFQCGLSLTSWSPEEFDLSLCDDLY